MFAFSLALSLSISFSRRDIFDLFVFCLPFLLEKGLFFASFYCFTYYTLIIHIYLTGQRKNIKNGVRGEWIIERGLFLLLFKTGKGLYFIRVHNWAFLSLSFKRFFVVFSHSFFKSVSVCV